MSDYYSKARREILPHIPTHIQTVLDIGCGTGVTCALIRSCFSSVRWMGGVEKFPDAAQQAETVLDQVWCGDLETMQFEQELAKGSLDLILCLDVLEHLVDPWRLVERLSPLLSENGRLIISIPNIRNWKFIRNLFFKGDFHYRDAGLLDRTHLRFFVRDTAQALAECGHLQTLYIGNAHPWKIFDFRNTLSVLTLRKLDDLMIKQYVVVAVHPKNVPH